MPMADGLLDIVFRLICNPWNFFSQAGGRRHFGPGRDAGGGVRSLNVGLILPHSIYNEREYNKAVATTIGELRRAKKPELRFLQKFHFAQAQVHRVMMKVNPSPTGE